VHDPSTLRVLHLEVSTISPRSDSHNNACSDILDAEVDKFTARTATRPLPSGSCTLAVAHTWFYLQLFLANVAMYTLLGSATHFIMVPCMVLSFFYPLSKRYIQWPQFVLAPTVGWPVFGGWLSAQAHAGLYGNVDLAICGPLFASYACWTIYYDTCYRLQDIAGDKESGVGSLAQFLGVNYIKSFLLGLNIIALGLLGLAMERSHCSLFLWTLGVGFWALSVPFQFLGLDPTVPGSGGKIFKFNISLGMYVTTVILAEAWVGGSWRDAVQVGSV
jgi:4-hydroxybenzoate polyprenyltransferase